MTVHRNHDLAAAAWRAALIAAAALVVVAFGCVDPLPDPAIVFDGISLGDDGFRGSPGTVSPPEGGVRPSTALFVPLTDDREAIAVAVAPDGSFGDVPLGTEGRFRFIGLDGDEPTTGPYDFEIVSATLVAYVPPLRDCLGVERLLRVETVSSGTARLTVDVDNTCAFDLEVADVSLRRADGVYAFPADAPLPSFPATIPAGGSATYVVDFTPGATGLFLNELKLDVLGGGEATDEWITLFGEGLP